MAVAVYFSPYAGVGEAGLCDSFSPASDVEAWLAHSDLTLLEPFSNFFKYQDWSFRRHNHFQGPRTSTGIDRQPSGPFVALMSAH